MKKRLLTVFITLSLMLSTMPSAVFAAGSEDYGFNVSSEEEAALRELEKAEQKYDKLKDEYDVKEAAYNEKKDAADTARQEYDAAKAEKKAADQAARDAEDRLQEAKDERAGRETGRDNAQSQLKDLQDADPNAAQELADARAAAQQAQSEAAAVNAAYWLRCSSAEERRMDRSSTQMQTVRTFPGASLPGGNL